MRIAAPPDLPVEGVWEYAVLRLPSLMGGFLEPLPAFLRAGLGIKQLLGGPKAGWT